MIAKVISGGQAGADEAGVLAARQLHIPTGGTMPRGWRTQRGPRPDFAHLYNMVEHASDSYGPRTFANVHAADITLRIAHDLHAAGEMLTEKACRQMGRPHTDVLVQAAESIFVQAAPSKHLVFARYAVELAAIDKAAEAIRERAVALGRPVVVNVAGNSERTAPGIGDVAWSVCRRIFEAVLTTGGAS